MSTAVCLYCDNCGTVAPFTSRRTYSGGKAEVRRMALAAGWTQVRKSMEWIDLCPGCRGLPEWRPYKPVAPAAEEPKP